MTDGRAKDLFERIVKNGVTAIEELIEVAASENLFLDFKRSADNGTGTKLHLNDRRNLGKAVSGFGNSSGGIVVWGVECSQDADGADVASAKQPIINPNGFKSRLEGIVSGVTVPPHSKVEHHAVLDGADKGFVASLIPASEHAPHQAVLEKQYYMRAGSSFMPVTHGVLAGMFGRRPNPNVQGRWANWVPERSGATRVNLRVGLILRNAGPGIAEHPFVNLVVWGTPGANCRIKMTSIDNDLWHRFGTAKFMMSIIARDGVRIPPGANLISLILSVSLAPPLEESLKLTGECGSAGCAAYPIDLEISASELHDAFSQFEAAMKNGKNNEEGARPAFDRLFQVAIPGDG